MLNQNQLQQIKEISIVDYLASHGHQPAKTHGNEYVYFSPIRSEHTPSFFVNPDKNVYKDWGKDGGDIIKLVMEMCSCNFVGAINILNGWKPGTHSGTISEIQLDRGHEVDSGIEILKVQPVTHQALVQYLASRKIPFSFAAQYVQEVHYQNRGKRFFSLGFANDNGGWALRNERFKNCVGANGITHMPVPGSNAVSVFEGFFDFLSALVYHNVSTPKNSVLVLNSTSNLKSSFSILTTYKRIVAYLDNDKAGKEALSQLEKWKFPVLDRSHIYQRYNDLSEMICQTYVFPKS